MPVTFERISGWLARIGPDHRQYGDAYTGTCVVCLDGTVKGLSGALSPRLISEARKAAEHELNLELHWIRIKEMAKYRVVVPGYAVTKIDGDTETKFHDAGPMEWNNLPKEAVVAMEAEGVKFLAALQKIGEAAIRAATPTAKK